jgi:hypothetical protein
LPEIGFSDGRHIDRPRGIGDRLVSHDVPAGARDALSSRVKQLRVNRVVRRQDREDRIIRIHAMHAEVVPADHRPAAVGGGRGRCVQNSRNE